MCGLQKIHLSPNFAQIFTFLLWYNYYPGTFFRNILFNFLDEIRNNYKSLRESSDSYISHMKPNLIKYILNVLYDAVPLR